ncbi:MAG: DEAD/DEAH box helicase [Epulopiscium sp. Nuni2H_MBin003]|nr:MAG: DEAD/DEAH box helicase [Epulopiscium sp. Nuni2H_MBin003]
MNKFELPFKRKLIYIFSIADDSHKGLLKIGEATIEVDTPIDKLPPNCSALNKAAKKRIDQYTNTAGITYHLLHTELAIHTTKDKNGHEILKSFRDHAVHNVLMASRISKKTINNTTGSEWFEVDLETAQKAIQAVKQCKTSISTTNTGVTATPIVFRPEQIIAIEKAVNIFKKKSGNKMLWNAKMRFGKTLCALEVVKRRKFKRTIIVTHRPVVNDGWYQDFKNIFIGNEEYSFGSKALGVTIDSLEKDCKKYVYFASVQDLRGSDKVGGKFQKNDQIFNTKWDFVVIDEAHEGTTTKLGENVVKELAKDGTKFLALSGTPFNILSDFQSEEVYTWDYIMEQKSKNEWDVNNFGNSNPYEELPKLNMFTYNLGAILGGGQYAEIEDKAFNFREFFRVWTGDVSQDYKPMPEGAEVGDFVHEKDVKSFLNLITKDSKTSNYPYSNKEYRALFKHSLWMVPGVKEARALSKLMRQHPIFSLFDIVNVAGDGDKEDRSNEALKSVRNAIATSEYTITLSCGKLTTGVTVPEWTAVMMLSGSYVTSASNYLQTIFRVQSPGNIDGRMKENCYVFDFAPDRTLKMIADAVNLSRKAGSRDEDNKRILGEFLNFCPVISVDGTKMVTYDTSKLLQQLKRAYAERAVKNGFDDNSIYNSVELSKLTSEDLDEFSNLKKIVGETKASHSTKEIDINDTGLTNEEYAEKEKLDKKKKKDRTAEEEEMLRKLKEKADNKKKAISVLRAISIRMPLMIYGAKIDFDEDIKAEDLIKKVDNSSWKEFMPKGVDKKLFKSFLKYYDMDVFVAASRKIRAIVKSADNLPPTERIAKITDLFSNFKNPDKETVLTPWRVVNMHMSDCLGGYNFYDEKFETLLQEPVFVDRGKVTQDTLNNPSAKILEINSKTGLYPLYVTYSIFRSRCDIATASLEEQEKIWQATVKENIFVICKTPMAKAITQRTLLGYKDEKANTHSFDDLIGMLKNKPAQFIDKVTKARYWGINGKGSTKVKFDAVVGNPPYQQNTQENSKQAIPIYNLFVEQAKELNTDYISMIIPSRWFTGGMGLGGFRENMLNDNRLSRIIDYTDSKDCFSSVDIAGGICYYLWDKQYSGDCQFTNRFQGKEINAYRKLNEFEIFIRDTIAVNIVNKILSKKIENITALISSVRPFGISTKARGNSGEIYLVHSQGIGKVFREEVTNNKEWIDKYKLITSKASHDHAGQPDKQGMRRVLSRTEILKPTYVCTESYIVLGTFDDRLTVENYYKYMRTKFIRFLVSVLSLSQDITRDKFKFVPLQNFANNSDIDWNVSVSIIDKQLYNKYDLTSDEINFIESKIKDMN